MARYIRYKRFLGITIAIILLCATFPLLLLGIVLTFFDGQTKPLFTQKRLGLNGKIFTIYKLRTMKSKPGPKAQHTMPDAPELTKIGRFLRNTALDELPQLFNVIKGDMAIIGPRPHAISFAEHYASIHPRYYERNGIKPGLICIVEITALHYRIHEARDIRARVKCDLYYLRNCSLALDLKILIKTFKVLSLNWCNVLTAGLIKDPKSFASKFTGMTVFDSSLFYRKKTKTVEILKSPDTLHLSS